MKKNLKLIISSCLTLLLIAGLVIFPPKSLACGGNGITDEDGNVTNCEDAPSDVEETKKIEEESEDEEYYFGSATNINSDLDVPNSLFLAGNEVASNDRVDGIGFLAGNILNITGVYNYGFFAGNSVKFSGTVDEDLFIAGNAVEIEEDASIGRDIFAAGNIVKIATNLSGNVFAGGNRLVLENVTINGDLSGEFDQIVVKGKSSISGTFKHNDDVEIVGLENLNFGSEKAFVSSSRESSFLTTAISKILSFAGTLILGIVLIVIFPKFAKTLLKEFKGKNVFKNVLIGLAILFFAPIALIFVMITVVGIPLGGVALGLWALLIAFALPVSSLVTGNLLAKKVFKSEKMNIFAKIAIGLASIKLLSLIPLVGGLVSFIALTFGIGYLLMSIIALRRHA